MRAIVSHQAAVLRDSHNEMPRKLGYPPRLLLLLLLEGGGRREFLRGRGCFMTEEAAERAFLPPARCRFFSAADQINLGKRNAGTCINAEN